MGIRNTSKTLKKVRAFSNLTQENFCDGICPSQLISKYENGHTIPQPEIFSKLCSKAGLEASMSPSFDSIEHFNTYLNLRALHYRVMKKGNYNIVKELNELYTTGHFTSFEYKCWLFLAYFTLRKYNIIKENDVSLLERIINPTDSHSIAFLTPLASVLDYEILYFYSKYTSNESEELDTSVLSISEKKALAQILSATQKYINCNSNHDLFNELILLKQNADLFSEPRNTLPLPSSKRIHIHDIIRITRTNSNISQEELAKGLCKRSELSLYEKGKIRLPLIIQECLLERLSYFDSIFTIMGKPTESFLYNVRENYYKGRYISSDTIRQLGVSSRKNTEQAIILQFKLLNDACKDKTHPDKELLLKAIKLTYKDFDPHFIHKMKLTKNELEIINQLARAHFIENETEIGELFLKELFEFYKINPYTAIFTNAKDFTLKTIKEKY